MFLNKLGRVLFCLLCLGLLLCACDKDTPGNTESSGAPSTGTIPVTTAPTSVPPTTVPPTTAPQVTGPELTDALLEGDWYHDAYWGDCMDLTQFTFHADGTFSYYDNLMIPYHKETRWYTYGTYWTISGWYTWPLNPDYTGTYAVSDNLLTICYSYWDYSIDEEKWVEITYAVELVDGELFLTDGETGETTLYRPGTFLEKNAEAPEVEISPLAGSWVSLRSSTEGPFGHSLYENSITFRSNGTFAMSSHDWDYMPNEETGELGWESAGRGYYTDHGTFTFDGTTLVLTFLYNDYIVYEDTVITYTVSQLDDTHFAIDDSWGTYCNTEAVTDSSLEGMCALFGLDYIPGE